MITKFLNALAFSPVYPVYQMCTLYIPLYNPINPSIFAGSYCRAYHFDMVFHRIHTNALTGVAISLQALIWPFDMSHKILLFICSHLWNQLSIKNDSLTYKTIINIQINKFTTSVIVIAIHFVTPIEKDRTRYYWFSIWKSYLSLLFLVIVVEICAKSAHRINRYCLKRVSGVTFSKNNGSNGLNMKTMEMTDGDHLEFWHSDLSKYTNDARNGLCVQ